MADRFSRSMNRMGVSSPSPRAEMGGGAGAPSCPVKPSVGCAALLRRLQVLDFSIADTVLYLDAYPHSAEALSHYRKLVAERGELIRKLSEDCHRPMTALDNGNGDAWHWTEGPWPWEPDAN